MQLHMPWLQEAGFLKVSFVFGSAVKITSKNRIRRSNMISPPEFDYYFYEMCNKRKIICR